MVYIFVRHPGIQTWDPDHGQNVTIDTQDRSANDPAFYLHRV